MKIVEEITPDNADKVILGPKKVKITYDTETGKVALNTPAIWGGDAEMDLSALREALDRFDSARGTVTYTRFTPSRADQRGQKVAVKDLGLGAEFWFGSWVFVVQEKDDDHIKAVSKGGALTQIFCPIVFSPQDRPPRNVISWDIKVVSRGTHERYEGYPHEVENSVPVCELELGDHFMWVGWLHVVAAKNEKYIQVRTVPSGIESKFYNTEMTDIVPGSKDWATVVDKVVVR